MLTRYEVAELLLVMQAMSGNILLRIRYRGSKQFQFLSRDVHLRHYTKEIDSLLVQSRERDNKKKTIGAGRSTHCQGRYKS